VVQAAFEQKLWNRVPLCVAPYYISLLIQSKHIPVDCPVLVVEVIEEFGQPEFRESSSTLD
jgi:hypothetical protein